MKLNIKLFFVAFLAFIFWACEEDLELQPEQDLSPEAAFANEAAANASLTGAYGRILDLDVFGAMPQIIGDFQADNVEFIGSFPTLQDINNSSVIADNGTIRTIFRDHYRAILAANAVIQNVPNVNDLGFSEEERAQTIAEAKFIRAIVHFSLVNLFGQPFTLDNGASPGITLRLEGAALIGDFPPKDRSSVSEVYDQIEQDLLDAVQDLPEVNGRVRASTGAANALLSRLYLYKGDNSNAADYAQRVLDEGNYELAGDYTFYNSLTPETVFDIAMSSIDNSRTGSGGWASFYNPAEDGARGDCPFAQDLIDAHEDGDRRFDNLTQVGDNGRIYTTKFPDVVTNADNAPIIRTTEVYLNRAEALVKASNSIQQEAIDIVNMLRDRAGLEAFSASDFASADELIATILDERRKELAFEGHRRMDLLRNGESIINGLMPGDDQTVMPIPIIEIDQNSSLPQNPGY
jgi:hypothetical protein